MPKETWYGSFLFKCSNLLLSASKLKYCELIPLEVWDTICASELINLSNNDCCSQFRKKHGDNCLNIIIFTYYRTYLILDGINQEIDKIIITLFFIYICLKLKAIRSTQIKSYRTNTLPSKSTIVHYYRESTYYRKMVMGKLQGYMNTPFTVRRVMN